MRPRTDRQIGEDVENALREAPTVDAMAIEVSSSDGVVELRGELGTHSERLSAMTVARRAAAPAPVRSELTVAPVGRDFTFTDADVAIEVARALVQSEIVPGTISFDVRNRVVTLHGAVADSRMRARVRHIVQSARGVDFIENRISVRAVESKDHREEVGT